MDDLPGPDGDWPTVDIVVPVHDEVEWVAAKLRNLDELDYPADRLRVWIVDGASADGTAEAAAPLSRDRERLELLRLPIANKTAQLNAALARAAGEWILVTDADARLHPAALSRLVAHGSADDEVAVVGTSVEPVEAHPLERLHWCAADRLRMLESGRGCASIVTGPCYLFRRALIGELPADVVADDVHIALTAASCGRRVEFIDAGVAELRTPGRLLDLFRQKLRKAEGYLREIRRFVPHLIDMRPAARRVFLWHTAQLTLVPSLAVAGLVDSVGWLATSQALNLPFALIALTAVAVLGTVDRGRDLLALVLLGLLLATVLLVTVAVHPFSRRTAHWPKVRAAPISARILADG